MTFHEGNVVSLAVGGPLMTVEIVRTDGLVSTVWMTDGKVNRDSFDPSALRKWIEVVD